MPMVAREPGPHLTAVTRSGRESVISGDSPPGVLLPPGGAPSIASAPAPDRVLALDALRLLRALRDPRHRLGRWLDPAFAREVELVRCHLAPMHGRTGLKASYSREAFHVQGPIGLDRIEAFGPVRVAYALRWLELGDRIARPAWPALLEHGGRT